MKRPYITLKFAETLDGKIAALDGSSRWISGPGSRRFAHRLRVKHDAVLVGVNTILKDDPRLTARLVKGRSPARVVIDGKLRTPEDARIVKGAGSLRTIIVTTPGAPKRKVERLRGLGVEFVVLPPSKGGRIDVRKIIRILYRKSVKSILVEGGANVITTFLRLGLADELVAIIAPKILGKGVGGVEDLGIRGVNDAIRLRLKNIRRSGDDIIYTASVAGK